MLSFHLLQFKGGVLAELASHRMGPVVAFPLDGHQGVACHKAKLFGGQTVLLVCGLEVKELRKDTASGLYLCLCCPASQVLLEERGGH